MTVSRLPLTNEDRPQIEPDKAGDQDIRDGDGMEQAKEHAGQGQSPV